MREITYLLSANELLSADGMGEDYLKLVASNGRMAGHLEAIHLPG
jgi:hypothetical protein